MIHHHPPEFRPIAKYCQRIQRDGSRTCRFHYPRPLQDVTTIESDGHVLYRRRHEEDKMVVPHCLPLLRALKCHLNFEIAGTSHLFQYLFKYIQKGMIS